MHSQDKIDRIAQFLRIKQAASLWHSGAHAPRPLRARIVRNIVMLTLLALLLGHDRLILAPLAVLAGVSEWLSELLSAYVPFETKAFRDLQQSAPASDGVSLAMLERWIHLEQAAIYSATSEPH